MRSSHILVLSVLLTRPQPPKILSLVRAELDCCSQEFSKVTLGVQALAWGEEGAQMIRKGKDQAGTSPAHASSRSITNLTVETVMEKSLEPSLHLQSGFLKMRDKGSLSPLSPTENHTGFLYRKKGLLPSTSLWTGTCKVHSSFLLMAGLGMLN